MMLTAVRSAPKTVIRNSDHNPARCATNLCASSCRRKEAVNSSAKSIVTRVNVKKPVKLRATSATSSAPRPRCLSSVLENQYLLGCPVSQPDGWKEFRPACREDGGGAVDGGLAIQSFSQSWLSGRR